MAAAELEEDCRTLLKAITNVPFQGKTLIEISSKDGEFLPNSIGRKRAKSNAVLGDFSYYNFKKCSVLERERESSN